MVSPVHPMPSLRFATDSIEAKTKDNDLMCFSIDFVCDMNVEIQHLNCRMCDKISTAKLLSEVHTHHSHTQHCLGVKMTLC